MTGTSLALQTQVFQVNKTEALLKIMIKKNWPL